MKKNYVNFLWLLFLNVYAETHSEHRTLRRSADVIVEYNAVLNEGDIWEFKLSSSHYGGEIHRPSPEWSIAHVYLFGFTEIVGNPVEFTCNKKYAFKRVVDEGINFEDYYGVEIKGVINKECTPRPNGPRASRSTSISTIGDDQFKYTLNNESLFEIKPPESYILAGESLLLESWRLGYMPELVQVKWSSNAPPSAGNVLFLNDTTPPLALTDHSAPTSHIYFNTLIPGRYGVSGRVVGEDGESVSGVETAQVTNIKIDLKSIEFISDHEDVNGDNILNDNNTDWKDVGGSAYSEPEWENGGNNNPISHTKNTKLKVKVKIRVEPAGISFDLNGDGLNGYADFNKTGIISTGTDQEITITADAKLPDQIDILNESIDWSIDIDGNEFNAAASGEHKIYVTYGVPSGSVVTEKRLAWSCSAAVSGNKSTLNDIVLSAHSYINDGGNLPNFNVDTSAWPEDTPPIWKLLDPTHSGASCIAHSNLLKHIVNILGIPGGELVYVFASTDSNFDSTELFLINGRTCKVVIVAGNGDINNYEGCLNINSKYYPGAFGTSTYGSKKAVHNSYADSPNRLLYMTIDSYIPKFMDKDYREYTNPLSVPFDKCIPLP